MMKKGVLNYVPSWTTCLTCLRALRVHVFTFLTYLRAFVSLPLTCFPYFSCLVCLYFFTCLTCLHILRTLHVFVCFTCLAFLLFFTCLACLHFFKCFHFFVMPYVPWPFFTKYRTTLSQLQRSRINQK